ncbi:MAG: DUF262 domain-containing HNH endonuclease family protein [Lachnospiraceae bacterium]|nr:DUF262 domain-containing HNH endonuclease family protein [Lachnospiraceae bacterium]
MAEIKPTTKKVSEIKGEFVVPSYQRGYRWGTDEVVRLLDDIYSLHGNEVKGYCLQPIVVKNHGDYYELIDGQQRLTTLYIIYYYMHMQVPNLIKKPKFSLKYKTRPEKEDFLEEMDLSMKEDNIDFWYMCNALETISEWIEAKEDAATAIFSLNKYFTENVKVIWYEADKNENPVKLFERLNIGKIALTSAELVKAMFLGRGSNGENEQVVLNDKKQEEIALQWDTIEKELRNDSLWFFLTNSNDRGIDSTRIDLILDLMCGKNEMDTKKKNVDKYGTFFAFEEMKKEKNLDDLWQDIMGTFLVLKDWYSDHEFYHKVGYLIASGVKNLTEIYMASVDKKKSEFREILDDFIRESIRIDKNYAELNYEESGDDAKIHRLLLLFNIESVRQIEEQSQWFPFDRFKANASWTLEHIHAQQSEGMNKQEEWRMWLADHVRSLKAIGDKQIGLIKRIEELLEKKELKKREFENIQQKVIEKLSTQGNGEYLHSICNLALLNNSDNAALSNSTFDVKRNKIIEMDQNGLYIPFCTKMVFLKYYTPSEDNQVHFWGQQDRIAYIQAINDKLEDYLEELITVEQGE